MWYPELRTVVKFKARLQVAADAGPVNGLEPDAAAMLRLSRCK